MNRPPDVELVLRAYLADTGDRAPDRVLEDVADRIARQPGRRTWRLRGRPFMNLYAKLAMSAAAIVLIGVVGYSILPRSGTGGVATPPPTSVATPSATPTPTPTRVPDLLLGTWRSGPSSCADQNAALQKAGFTTAQLALASWDAATCTDTSIGSTPLTHGSVHELQFSNGGGLVELADGALGWSGFYRLTDAGTFVAGDNGRAPYITYTFTISGNTLVIDMVSDDIQGLTEQQRWSDTVAQTVIYESGPFTRVP